ncbi:MAG: HlyD family efflux transporter periplasmic adaptor subunit [Chitinophagales bacterium]
MNLRTIITSILAILLVVGAVFMNKKLSNTQNPPKPKPQKKVAMVVTDTVKNGSTPITITTSGNLAAKERIELFAEVQGIFEDTGRDFLPGEYYKKGDLLIKINADEHRANMRAQKSTLYNQIVGLLPDLRMDYPESFPNWEAYVRDFNIDRFVPQLPTPFNEKEKLFIAGRNILPTFYSIKNMEERLSKYTIHAPFSGILTQSLVRHGALVRAGQNLGELINPNLYELEVAINTSYADLLKIGKTVDLHNVEKTKTWKGKVARINSLVEEASQTIPVFIQVSGSGLKEGMYLEAEVTAKEEVNTYELSRKLLFDENKVFVVKDSFLVIHEVNPVFFKQNTVVVRGLENGTQVLAKSLPGAYDGMKVKIFE